MIRNYGTEKVICYKNVSMVYYLLANKGKETLFLLHSAFADHEIFEAQIDFFRDDYQLVLLDFPGHGKSRAKGMAVTMMDIADIMKEILDKNMIADCHVVGVSLGSLVAQDFAQRYEDMVRSITIVGGYSIHKANEHILKAQAKEGLKWMLYTIFSMKKFRAYVTKVSTCSDRGREIFGRGIEKFKRRSFPSMSNMKSLFTKKETEVTYPLMIISGEHDLQLSKDAAILLHGLESHSKYALIPDAGHCANIDNPDAFNAALEVFLSGL